MTGIFVNIITIPDSPRHLSVRLPASTTVAELRTRWTQTFPTAQDFEIQAAGRPQDDHFTLAELPTVAPGVNIVSLVIVEPSFLFFRLSPGAEQPQEFNAFLSSPPSALLPRLREHFHLDPNLDVRILMEGDPIYLDESFEKQGITHNALLTLEIRLRVHLRSQWSNQAERRLIYCYPSDIVGQTLTLGLAGDFQLYFEERLLSLETTIGEALQLNSTQEVDYRIDVHSQRTITVLSAEGTRQVSISPESTIASLGIFPTAICDGSLAPTSQAIADIDDGILVSDFITVIVDFQESRRCSVLRLSRHATVGDLQNQVPPVERVQEVALFFRGEQLNSLEASLSSVGIDDGSRVEARKKQAWLISLKTLNGLRPLLALMPGIDSVNYDDLRRFHASEERQAGYPCPIGWDIAFRCNGCGRKMMAEESETQLVPSSCCKKKSLNLTATRKKSKLVKSFGLSSAFTALDILRKRRLSP